MNASVAERVAVLEAERAIPTPRLPKRTVAATAPVSPADQARHRAELLAALRGTA